MNKAEFISKLPRKVQYGSVYRELKILADLPGIKGAGYIDDYLDLKWESFCRNWEEVYWKLSMSLMKSLPIE